MIGDYGAWLGGPSAYSLEGGAIGLAGGDVGLTPRLSLRLFGGEGLFRRFSGILAALQYSFLPYDWPFRASLSAGYTEAEAPGDNSRWLFSRLNLAGTYDGFALGVMGSIQAPIGGASASPAPQAAASLTYLVSPLQLGIEYFVGGGSARSGAGLQQAITPSVSVPMLNGQVSTKLSSALGVGRTTSVPMKIAVSGLF